MDPRNRTREKWIGYILLMLSSIALVWATAESAAPPVATKTPDTYQITFEIRFRKLGDADFPTKADVTGTNLDIASVNSGGTAGTLKATDVKPGKYDKAQAKLNCTATLKGSVAYQGTTYYTTSGGGVSTNVTDLKAGSYKFPGSCAAAENITVESPVFSPELEIGGTLIFKFNIADSLGLSFTGIAPEGPQLSAGAFSASMKLK